MPWQVKRVLVLVLVVALLRLEVSTATAVDQQNCAWPDAATATGADTGHDSSQVDIPPAISGMSALVLGGTGAVGEEAMTAAGQAPFAAMFFSCSC
jgi:hypothetical protein